MAQKSEGERADPLIHFAPSKPFCGHNFVSTAVPILALSLSFHQQAKCETRRLRTKFHKSARKIKPLGVRIDDDM
jgi:hypothetical protein